MAMRSTEHAGRSHGSVVAAWWNVVVCAVLMIGIPVAALSRGLEPVHIVIAAAAFVVAGWMERRFVANLREQRAHARAHES